ncbi:hypothetical protein NYE25_05865 [Paenibacillus sp. FSL E2-8871]|uniref:hypothetical protein n=1 Tax=Paenibacillus sp. FSL E2-8871 TaxID=2975326 RepID=UPI0030FCE198
MNRLVDKGSTDIVIEHNLDVISQADWIIDMGPDEGSRGGQIIFEANLYISFKRNILSQGNI